MFKPPAIRRMDLKEYRNRLSDNGSGSRFFYNIVYEKSIVFGAKLTFSAGFSETFLPMS